MSQYGNYIGNIDMESKETTPVHLHLSAEDILKVFEKYPPVLIISAVCTGIMTEEIKKEIDMIYGKNRVFIITGLTEEKTRLETVFGTMQPEGLKEVIENIIGNEPATNK